MKLKRMDNESENDWVLRQIAEYNRQSKIIIKLAIAVILVGFVITIINTWNTLHR